MNKAFNNFIWKDEPDHSTPLNAENLNEINAGLNEVDNRVIALDTRIINLQNVGHFLALWNCVTGRPTSEPSEMPYAYKTGDYYRISNVATGGGTNYRPSGSYYDSSASTDVDTSEELDISAVYYYDGTTWLLQKAGGLGKVRDVLVNEQSVVDSDGNANIDLTGKENLVVVSETEPENPVQGDIWVNPEDPNGVDWNDVLYKPLLSNRNLLDNPFFQINQRGQSDYRGMSSSGAYTFDRWKLMNGSGRNYVTKNDDGTVTIASHTNGFMQLGEDNSALYGKTVTISIKDRNDVITSITTTFHNTVTSLDNMVVDGKTIQLYCGGQHLISINTLGNIEAINAITIKAVKLELGSVSTLANDVAPNYAEELAKCQRYLIALAGSTNLRLKASIITSGTIDFNLPIPTTMRVRPTFIDNGIYVYNTSFSQLSGFSISVIGNTDVSILIRATKASHGLNDAILSVTEKSFLSAEL